jgi:hypothetical protein
MKRNNTWLIFIAVIGFAALCLPLSGEEADLSQVYDQIDKAFADKSTQELTTVLQMNTTSASYSMYEAYALKKTRQLIIADDLEFAREASLIVIDNNLENFDAVDLYSYIDKAILNEQAQKQAEENRRKLEQDRIAAQNEKTKKKLKESYQTVSTSSGQSVYISEQQANYSPILWNIDVGIADIMYQKITDPDYASFKYGLGLGVQFFYSTEQFVLGGEMSGDFLMLTMGSGEEEVLTSAKLVPEISFAKINKNLFLRVGFALQGLITNEFIDSGSQKTFMTPVLGLGLDNVLVGGNAVAAHFDYYPGHAAYSNLKAAFEGGASILFPLTESERSKIGIKLGASDVCFIKDKGIENRGKVIFAIGVGNVNK